MFGFFGSGQKFRIRINNTAFLHWPAWYFWLPRSGLTCY